ncbi:hypothetical protein TEA_016248 [Camellia sinensis var. sinensis]|uniref:Peptidase M50 domain-containing protein n=1 Tax=Camellia sinensis var. sinensis TaxID=542762 RepID=A0A4V3WQA8_CAMSN|nr:hypothetical protein TEA_016248 [Camellia sinensis var. sinensis]
MLRKEVSEQGPTTLWQYVIALLLFVLTIGSSVELRIASQQINRLPPEVVKYFTDPNVIEPPDMQLLFPFVELCPGIWCPGGLVISQSITHLELAILKFYACVIVSSSYLLYTLCIRCMRLLEAAYKVGHFLAAFPKKVKLSIPFFIPNITLGSFCAITQVKSILPDRKTKVDISLAGPFTGATLSFSMFVVGLLLSSNPNAAGDLVQVPSMLFQGSLLLGLISRATLGYVAMHTATVWVHPLVIAGWCGLTTSAFNMLPVGCLDGGRAIQVLVRGNGDTYGGVTNSMSPSMRTKEAAKDTFKALWHELGGPLSLPWGLYMLMRQRAPEKPCLNDVTDWNMEETVLTVAIFLVVLTLLPVWDELAKELGKKECSSGLLIERLIEVCFRDDVPNELYTLDDLDHQDGPENWAYHDLTVSSSPIMD